MLLSLLIPRELGVAVGDERGLRVHERRDHVSLYIDISVYICIHMCVYVYIYIYIYTHVSFVHVLFIDFAEITFPSRAASSDVVMFKYMLIR